MATAFGPAPCSQRHIETRRPKCITSQSTVDTVVRRSAIRFVAVGYNTGTMLPNLPGQATAVVAAAQALPFGVAITDPHGTITWANAAYAQLSGCSPDQLLGQSAGTFAWDELLHATPSAEPWRNQVICKRKTGETYSAEHSITTLRGPAEQIMGFWITKQDMTGLKRPAGVYEAEANLSALIESTEDIIWSVDLNYRLVTFNRALHAAFERSFGVAAAVGMGPDDLLPPERAALFPPLYKRALSEGPFRADYVLLDGRTLELSFNPIRHEGRAVGISVFGKDITERKSAANSLRDAEAKYRQIFERAMEGIYRTSPDGRSLAANPALAKMLGYDSADDLLSEISDTAHQVWLDPDERVRCLQLLSDHDVVRGYECQLKRKDGAAAWASLNIQKVHGDDGQAYYEGFVENISDRKEVEPLRSVFENMGQGAAFCKLLFENNEPQDILYITVNAAFESLTGLTNVQGKRISEVIPGVRRTNPELFETYARVVATGNPESFETFVAQLGAWLSISVYRAKPEHFIAVFDNITDRKRAEEELSRAHEAIAKGEANLSALIESTDDLIWSVDLDYRLLTFNNALRADVLSSSAIQVAVGMRPEEWMPPERAALWPPMFACALSDGPFRVEYPVLSGRTLELSFNPIRRDGQAIGVSVFGKDITERKQSEDILREAERKYRSLFDGALEGVYRTTLQGTSLAANPALAKMLGYESPQELISTLTDTTHQLWLDPHERSHFFGLVNEQKIVRNYECQFKRKDGTAVWVKLDIRKVENEGKAYYEGFIEDVSERKGAEANIQEANEALAKAERHYRHLFNSIGDALFVYELRENGLPMPSHYLEVNDSACRLLGYTREELLQLGVTDVVPLEERSAGPANARKLLADGQVTWSGSVTTKKGAHVPVAVSTHVFDLDGSSLAISSVRDITDIEKAEEERQQTEQRYRSLFDSMEEGVAIHKLVYSNGTPGNYVLLEVNRRYEEIVGLSREDVVSRAATEVYGTQSAPYLQEYASVVETATPSQFETYFPPMDKHFAISVAPMGDDRFATIFFDVTDRRKAQQAIQQAHESVANAEAHYRLMFNNVSDAVFVHEFREDGLPSRYLEVNDSACRYSGYTREELVQMGPFDLDAPEEHSDVAIRSQRILTDGHLVWEGTHVAKDGRRIPVEVNTHLVNLDGLPTIISSVREISDRKEAESKYRNIFDGALEGIFRTSLDGTALLANPALATMLGYDSAEEYLAQMKDTTHQIWMDPNERSEYLKLFEKQEVIRGYECQLKRRDGKGVWVSVNSRKVGGQDGQLLYTEGFMEDITERKLAERKLLESEERFRSLFENATLGIYRTTPDGRIDIANPTLLRMLGYESFSALAERDLEKSGFEPSYSRSVFRKILEEQGTIRGLESTWTRRDGSSVSVLESVRCVKDEAGAATFYDGIVEDITERKGMQDALRKSEEKFAKAFRCSPAVTILAEIVGESDRIVEVNEAFEQITGYRVEDAVGHSTEELALWADSREFNDYVQQLQAHGRIRNYEMRFRRKNDEVGAALLSAEFIELDGKPHVISEAVDITEQKKAEQARTTLVTAIEQASETIVITDLAGTIQYCNPAFSKVTGYSKEEAIGQNPRVLKSGKHSQEFYEELWATITQGSVWTGHLVNKKKDGSLYEEDVTISPIRDTPGEISGFVAVKRDVTDRLHLEDQLRQAQKLESIGRLAGGVAHDFNNLLTVINGYSGFLLKRLKAGDPLRAYAEQITIAGERAASLTKQLLAFSRKQVIEPTVLDVNAIIRESTVMLRRLIGDDIVLETHLDSSLGQVMADPDQIHQIIMNLAVNARDAMPDGGALDIETLNVELTREDGADDRGERDPGRYVLMTVTDTGHGMDETIQKQAFEPFFTTKGVGKGTGLGLSTVYGIMRQSGGWIDVWSEVGVGTIFKMYLPSIDACQVAERKGISASTEGSGETILLVEDQKEVRSFAKAALRQHGYPVLEAFDGDEALSVVKQHLGQIDLLVTDVIMPGLNGKELSERLKELRPNLKVLFISGYTADVIANRGVLDPGVAFLHKPFGQEELARKVREVLAEPSKPKLDS